MNLCYYQEKYDADHHQAPVVQKVNSIYPVDSAIQLLNNRGQGVNEDQGMRSIGLINNIEEFSL